MQGEPFSKRQAWMLMSGFPCLSSEFCPLYTRPILSNTKSPLWDDSSMLPWSTSAHRSRHLPSHQPGIPSTFPPPVLPSSGDGVALLSFVKMPPSLYALLSSELFEGVLHSPSPLKGWRGGAVAGGECRGQHRRNSVFIGWWEWFISSVWWRFNVLFFKCNKPDL